MMREKLAELDAARLWQGGEVDDGEASCGGSRAVGELVQFLFWREAVIVVPEPVEVSPAFLIGKPFEIRLPNLIVGIRQELVDLHSALRLVMEDNVAHDTDEGIVDRVLERLEDRRILVIFPSFEIGEDVHAAAGEERARTARIMALMAVSIKQSLAAKRHSDGSPQRN